MNTSIFKAGLYINRFNKVPAHIEFFHWLKEKHIYLHTCLKQRYIPQMLRMITSIQFDTTSMLDPDLFC